MVNFDRLSRTPFFKSGAIRFNKRQPKLCYSSNIAVFDTTLYKTAEPKTCILHEDASYRPHLVRHLNFLQTPEEVEMRNAIQLMWEQSNQYIDSLGHEVYQSFLVINSPGVAVPKHAHFNKFDGDTVTLQMSVGSDYSSNVVFSTPTEQTTYPKPDGKFHVICFNADEEHWTDGTDNNYHIHFVYDVLGRVDGLPRVKWFEL